MQAPSTPPHNTTTTATIQGPSTPPRNNPHAQEADTIRKTRFFEACDTRARGVRIQDVAAAQDLSVNTGKKWLKQRRVKGMEAYRRNKTRSGRPKKLSDGQLDLLLDDSNPVKGQSYKAQIEHHKLDISTSQLKANLNERRGVTKRYPNRKAITRPISEKNKAERVNSGKPAPTPCR